MSARFHLYRRNGTYYFRWTIPHRLRQHMLTGSPVDVRISLRTHHYPIARVLAARHWLAALDTRDALLATHSGISYNALLDAIRGRVAMVDALAAADDDLISLVELAGTTEPRYLIDTLARLDALGADLFLDVPPLGVTVWQEFYDEDGERTREIIEKLDDFSDSKARLTRKAITGALAAERNLFEVPEFYSDQVGFWTGSPDHRDYHSIIAAPPFKTNISAIKVAARWRGRLSTGAATGPAFAQPPVVTQSASTDCAPIRLSDALIAWVGDNSKANRGTWSSSTEANYKATIEQFIDIAGNHLTTELTPSHFKGYEDRMKALPSDWAKIRKQSGLPIATIELQGKGRPKVSTKTLKDKGATIGTFFVYLKGKGYWHGRFGSGLFSKIAKDKNKKDRATFSNADLQKIFAGSGLAAFESAKFPLYIWGTLLLLYTGARPGEVSQLRAEDVQQTPDGTWYVQFAENDDEGDDGKTLKTESSIRAVPLHPILIDLGFLNFASRIKAGTWLFPEAHRHNKKVSKEIGDWANNKLLVAAGLKAPGVVLYSLRHTVIKRFKQDARLDHLACAYTGHSTASDRTMSNREFVQTYGKNFSPDELAASLHDLLDFGIDWSGTKQVLVKKGWA